MYFEFTPLGMWGMQKHQAGTHPWSKKKNKLKYKTFQSELTTKIVRITRGRGVTLQGIL